MARTADVVVVGAGIAGVSAAYHLAVRHPGGRVVIVDPRPPLTLTSDKSTECYRNWWPSRAMVGLMNRSIDILEELAAETGNVFGLNRRGYLFVTGDNHHLEAMTESAHHISTLGAGPVRIHPGPEPYRPARPDGHHDSPGGADVLVGSGTVAEHFPYLTDEAVGAVHVRRAGWLSAHQLGAWMLERSRDHGAELTRSEVAGIEVAADVVKGVTLADGEPIESPVVVNAAGPLSHRVAAMAGIDLPVYSEVHLKVAYRDHLGVIPRDAPMIIWSDPQHLGWDADERSALREQGREDLLGEMPIFCHGRPEGGPDSPYLLALWEYHGDVREPDWPLPDDPLYPEVVMRGLSTMVPGLTAYLDRLPHSVVDGGYYSKTKENRPLIGPAGPSGFHLVAGMSGFGVMASPAAGDLVARHITGAQLPELSDDFLLSRYDDLDYVTKIQAMADSGQL